MEGCVLVTSVKPRCMSDGDRVTSNNTLSSNSNEDSVPVVSDGNNERKPQSMTPGSPTLNTTSATSIVSSANLTVIDDASTHQTEDITIMPEDFSRKLVAQVKRRLDTFLASSPYIKSNCRLQHLPRFTSDNLNLGKVLAKGGFSNIIEVKDFGLTRVSPDDEDDGQCRQQQTGECVVKCLSVRLALKKLPGASKDIVFEAHTLASLQHENIVQIRGWSFDGIDGFQSTRRADGFFIILDRLGDTLFQKVFQWQAQLTRRGTNGDKTKKKISIQKIVRHQFQEKIQICIDVASALEYCHERRICHRDIKSANVALDRNGRAKLIDFGLAVELPALQPNDSPHKVYELTGNIGTARYMSLEIIAPVPGSEVHRYNEKTDVHSFAILCWEACAAKKPYAKLDAKKVKERVSLWNERPKPYWSWPRKLRRILKKGWARDPKHRPTMAEFHTTLLKVQASLPKSTIDLTIAGSTTKK
jgi:serine/threonine protein kinase